MKNMVIIVSFFVLSIASCAQTATLPQVLPAHARSAHQSRARNHVLSLTLFAVNRNGRDAFSQGHGATIAPVIRAFPGDVLSITYINQLPANSTESCALGPCMNMTNLHFHGLLVSPNAPQDDVLGMMAAPGERLHYSVKIPRNHTPGLFWYHTHPHGESDRQVLDGMSGAIVIEGMERYVPEVAKMREQILMVRGRSIEHDPDSAQLMKTVDVPSKGCGGEAERTEEIFTVNGELRPRIQIAPGERQFWRMVNASPDRYLDVQLDGQKFEIVALDGMPLAYHDPEHPTRITDHLLLPPAGRLEAIVTGPPAGENAKLRTRCVDTGPDGDPNPEMVLADIAPSQSFARVGYRRRDSRKPVYVPVSVELLQSSAPDFVVTFTEDKQGFYINGAKYSADAAPMTTVHAGTYQHWRIVNQTAELHPFHIHQVHFLAYAENGSPLPIPAWLDTVNVPYHGTVDVIVDFTDPIIKGMSVFHCHLLNHEDKGMMAKILIE